MIRVLIVDDHPAMRAGLTAVLRAEPGVLPLGAVASAGDIPGLVRRTVPDVVVLDYHLPSDDGLAVCRRLKREAPASRVLLYSAFTDAALVVPAILAGADGLLNKGVPAAQLCDAVRSLARGERVLPPVTRAFMEPASGRLEAEDLPILAMLLDGEPLEEVARTLRIDLAEADERLDAMLRRLRVDMLAQLSAA